MFYFILIVNLLAVLQYTNAAPNRVVCYFNSVAESRSGNGNVMFDEINSKLCTHLIMGFATLNPDGHVTVTSKQQSDLLNSNYLTTENPSLTLMLGVGGPSSQVSAVYSQVAASMPYIQNLVSDLSTLKSTLGIGGVDLYWAYPAQNGGQPADVQNFITLLQQVRAGMPGSVLSITVGGTRTIITTSYNVPSIIPSVDFINVMSYNLHGYADGITGENAPMYPSSAEVTDAQQQYNMLSSIGSWLDSGVPPAQLNLGIAAFGVTYTLSNPANNGVGAPVSGPGNPGPYTNQSGILGYNEIVELQNAGGWTVNQAPNQVVPYMYKGDQWVGYDDPQSVQSKTILATALDLGGYMLWSIDTDDFLGLSDIQYPILQVLQPAVTTTVAPTTTTQTTTEATTPSPTTTTVAAAPPAGC